MGSLGDIMKAVGRTHVPQHAVRAPVIEAPKRYRRPFPFAGYVDFDGLPIDIENVKGSFREGIDKDGHAWKVEMRAHYGELHGAAAQDGDYLDVYVGPDAESPLVVVVHQFDPETGKSDEDKCCLGFRTAKDAVAMYRSQYDKPGFYGGHDAMSIARFRRLAFDPKRKGKMLKGGGLLATILKGALTDAPELWIELPEAYGAALYDGLTKGLQHKYLKRVRGANGRYRYFYAVATKAHDVGHEAHMVVGSAFKAEGGHWHITHVDGDRLTIGHDESGEIRHVTKAELSKMLREHHAAALTAHRERAALPLSVRRLAPGAARDAKVKELAATKAKPLPEGAIPVTDEHGVTHDARAILAEARARGASIAKVRVALIEPHNERTRALAIYQAGRKEAEEAASAAWNRGHGYEGRVVHGQSSREALASLSAEERAEIETAHEAANVPLMERAAHTPLTIAAAQHAINDHDAKQRAEQDAARREKEAKTAPANLSWGWNADARSSRQHPAEVGEIRKPEGRPHVVVTKTASRYVREDGLSFGLGDDRGWYHTADVRPATPEEVAHYEKTREEPARKAAEYAAAQKKVTTARTAMEALTHYKMGEEATDYRAATAAPGTELIEEHKPFSGRTDRYQQTPEHVYRYIYDSDSGEHITRFLRTPERDKAAADLKAASEALAAMPRPGTVPSVVRSPRAAEMQTEKPAPKAPAAPVAAKPPSGPLPTADAGIKPEHHAKAQSLGLTLRESGKNAVIGGSGTYNHKDARIKPHGGRYNGDGTWSVPLANLHKVLKGWTEAPGGLLATIMKSTSDTPKLTPAEAKAVMLSRIDSRLRWMCRPRNPDTDPPTPMPVCDGDDTDAEVADRLTDELVGELSYSPQAIAGVRAIGGIEKLRGVVLGRIPAMRAKLAAEATKRPGRGPLSSMLQMARVA